MQLRYEPSNNALLLTLNDDRRVPVEQVELAGYVEMGSAGRLAGVELLEPNNVNLAQLLTPWINDEDARPHLTVDDDAAYIELSESDAPNEPLRAASATLRAELDGEGQLIALAIPRHGSGYEITYPSGNQ